MEKNKHIAYLALVNLCLMNRRTEDKYLGQILHEDGLAASIAATINNRSGRFKGAVFETRSVIEEFAMQAMAGMAAAKTLLERALIPSLFHGAGNWIGINRKTEEKLDDLILLFWRVMFKVPESTPKIALMAETGTMRARWRIWLAKLMLVKRIHTR